MMGHFRSVGPLVRSHVEQALQSRSHFRRVGFRFMTELAMLLEKLFAFRCISFAGHRRSLLCLTPLLGRSGLGGLVMGVRRTLIMRVRSALIVRVIFLESRRAHS